MTTEEATKIPMRKPVVCPPGIIRETGGAMIEGIGLDGISDSDGDMEFIKLGF
eukprot:CAMPEP_0201900370 /NCGR_PEP_ID=MMETSP0902-20130614/52156_1 /ASSEMBLY_ACC=CAM_ASM_000551 /TAXON_ID=420261 /ORGANISM="Thalassiosira antarctica, Strain CCMP982" /LENGTH=52 /DNA_ID=CAMNT_0048434011 /DNA_START=121 /DNA_END=276 /DNA_ORIENTATION=-